MITNRLVSSVMLCSSYRYILFDIETESRPWVQYSDTWSFNVEGFKQSLEINLQNGITTRIVTK